MQYCRGKGAMKIEQRQRGLYRMLTKIRQFNYYSKKHIDATFAKYEVDSDLTEWYTPEKIQEKYGMTRVTIRSHVYRNNIPSKKEHGQIFYSKLHFDLSKSSEQESKAEYYTIKEAMEKFKLSRDSVYGILQFHQIRISIFFAITKSFNILW